MSPRKPEVFLEPWVQALERLRVESSLPDYHLVDAYKYFGRIPVGLTGAELIAESNYVLNCLESQGYLKSDVTFQPATYWGETFDNFEFSYTPKWEGD